VKLELRRNQHFVVGHGIAGIGRADRGTGAVVVENLTFMQRDFILRAF
jgi:hypothetical protein